MPRKDGEANHRPETERIAEFGWRRFVAALAVAAPINRNQCVQDGHQRRHRQGRRNQCEQHSLDNGDNCDNADEGSSRGDPRRAAAEALPTKYRRALRDAAPFVFDALVRYYSFGTTLFCPPLRARL
jgi:hypothetical protein